MARDSLGGVNGSSTLSVVLSLAAAVDGTVVVKRCRLTGGSGASAVELVLFAVAVVAVVAVAVLQSMASSLQHSCRGKHQVRGMSSTCLSRAGPVKG